MPQHSACWVVGSFIFSDKVAKFNEEKSMGYSRWVPQERAEILVCVGLGYIFPV